MAAMYQQCDVFILPNRTIGGDIEGFGMVLLEAQACGKYVVAGNSGGTKETMRVGETGFVIDCSSPDAIVDGFSMVMQKLPSLTMSPSEFVKSTFSWDVHVEKARALFDRFAN
jgi:phosphatidylinositol alpha-1,6-mannosyltransferase